MSIQYFNGCALSSSSLTTWSEVKILGPVQKDRLARMVASRGGAMRSQAGDCIGGGDPDKDGGGVEALLREEDPSLKGERGRLMFFLSSIDLKRRERKTLSADYRCTRWIAAQDDEDIYRLRGEATVMDGVLEVQTVRQTVQLYEKGVRRRDGRAADDTCLRTCQDE
jgi:hypothetical protein